MALQRDYRNTAEDEGLSGGNLKLACSAFDQTVATMVSQSLIRGS